MTGVREGGLFKVFPGADKAEGRRQEDCADLGRCWPRLWAGGPPSQATSPASDSPVRCGDHVSSPQMPYFRASSDQPGQSQAICPVVPGAALTRCRRRTGAVSCSLQGPQGGSYDLAFPVLLDPLCPSRPHLCSRLWALPCPGLWVSPLSASLLLFPPPLCLLSCLGTGPVSLHWGPRCGHRSQATSLGPARLPET